MPLQQNNSAVSYIASTKPSLFAKKGVRYIMNNFFGRTIIPLRLGANRVAYATSVPSLISNRCAKINSLPRSVDGQGIIFSIGKNSSRINLLRLRRLSDKPNPRQDVEKIIRVAKTNKTSEPKTFYGKFLGPKQMPERNTAAWYREMLLICTVFGITGSSTMLLVRPAVKEVLGIQGTFKDGPWSYRICSIVIMSPIYATLLVVVGTLFGRHAYFRHFAVKIFSRFGLPPEILDRHFHQTKTSFRKW